MKYTLWLNGHLLGETRLEHRGPVGAQRMGALRPTTHGLELLPGLCGFLSAAAALKKAMQQIGVDPDRDVERAMQLLDSVPEARRFSELVKALCELELRDADGERAAFHTLVITDIRELAELSQSFDPDAELAQGVPRYILSATPVDFKTLKWSVRSGARMRLRMEPN